MPTEEMELLLRALETQGAISEQVVSRLEKVNTKLDSINSNLVKAIEKPVAPVVEAKVSATKDDRISEKLTSIQRSIDDFKIFLKGVSIVLIALCVMMLLGLIKIVCR